MIEKIMREYLIKSLKSEKARAVISEELAWVLIDASIRHGELNSFIKQGTNPASKMQRSKRTALAKIFIKQLFPQLPESIISETVRKFSAKYNVLIEKAIQRASKISIA